MKVQSTEPGVQFYTGKYVCDVKGKSGAVYQEWAGLCLETQTYPDSVEATGEFGKGACFILRPGGPNYCHEVVYQMFAEQELGKL
jgi:aldose 1-epimerase